MANYQNVTPNLLGQAAVTTSYATIYTVPTGTRTYVKQIDICNTTNGAVTIFISFVPSAGTAGASNALYYGQSIAANTTLSYSGVQVLLPGATIQVKGGATGLTVTASGGEAV
jgi:hypothetical protein